ncbi:OprO/OprP family phosphate-selective porin [Peristeroidobacter agariperforans]|uniref:OprO/OprP family phosphate-selective porin n=1 Tax=Peristeroidobacter agariperforans TaxID=268404 RepID=UPI00101BF05F|nr:porin [Peristeroidobacter agariperforans]
MASNLLAGSIAVVLGVATAGTQADELSELRERLDAQEQKIRILERKLELQEEAAKAAAPTTPIVRASPQQGFRIQSADGANVARLRGVLHFDGRYFADDATPETADTWLLRRVRPTFEGTFNNIYDFRFTPDFAGGRTIILDAFIAARLKPWAVVTAGKFKVPVGLERLVSSTDLRFIERGLPTSLVPNRDLGLQLGGDIAGGVVNYSLGYFNGVGDGSSSDSNTPNADAENDTKGDWAARVFVQPFLNSDNFALRGLGFGVAGTYVNSTGNTTTTLLPSYRTPGQQTFFSYRGTTNGVNGTIADGERLRWTPQAYYSIGSFGVLGEYVTISQDVSRLTATAGLRRDTLDNTAWQLQLAWFATGEDESFRGFTPQSIFDPSQGTWGALELVARYHELDIDDDAFVGAADSFANPATAASKASAWGVGVNWYLTQNYKWSLNYDVTSFEGGAAIGDRADEKALFTRFAVGF